MLNYEYNGPKSYAIYKHNIYTKITYTYIDRYKQYFLHLVIT